MKYLRIAWLATMVCFPSVCSAQGDEWNPATKFLVVEGLIGANAYLASKNPRGWGGFQAALVPVLTIVSAGDPKAGPAEPWLILIGGGALAAYNLKVDTDKTSESKIFKTNFLGLNALVGAGLAINLLTGKSGENKKMSLAYAPGPRGGNLVFSYRF